MAVKVHDKEEKERTIATLRRLYQSYPGKIEAMMLNRTLSRKEQMAELERLKEEKAAIASAVEMLAD